MPNDCSGSSSSFRFRKRVNLPAVFACLFMLAASCATAQAQVVIDAPRGGWKHSGGESAQHMQDVNYPASRVNAGVTPYNEDGIEMGSAIHGRITSTPKSDSQYPHLLVINGVPLPLAADDSGDFARPYAFPPGANNVEVRSSDREHARRISFYDSNVTRTRIGLRIVLSWDTDMTDLDLHVVSPDGEHVYYGNRVGMNGGALDVDVTGGYGPEIYAIASPPRGNWQVYTNYYGGGWNEGDNNGELSVAQIFIVTHEGTPDERQQTFRIPMRRPGELTLIKSFMYP